MSINFFFIGLPYAAIILFLVGSIIRYKHWGFQVTSLSSQFLESEKLFFGSKPFHNGIIVLFFGHLIAFIFPRSVIAWNSQPVRLIILELTAFAFGISALFGAVMLITRRLVTKRIWVVTSIMDILVYLLIFTQLITGLLIAYNVRWGSTWFATSLTPYLKSIFIFAPNARVITEMPFIVKLHIITAFVLVGIIPFTRLMHILVFPFKYITRKYQIVIWNWDRKKRRLDHEKMEL